MFWRTELGGVIDIISAQKAPLPPSKKFKGRGDSSAGRRLAERGAVGRFRSRLVGRPRTRGFREAGATAAAVLVALKTAADCKNLGLSQSGPPSVDGRLPGKLSAKGQSTSAPTSVVSE